MHVDLMCRPNPLNVSDICVMRPAHKLALVVVLELGERVIILSDPEVGVTILRNLGLLGRGLKLPASSSVERLLSEQPVFELVGVAFFEVFKAEIGAEEPRGSILHCNPSFAIDGRSPHPLVRGPVRMVEDKQSDSFYFRRRSESQDYFARAVRPHAVILPALLGDLVFGIDNP